MQPTGVTRNHELGLPEDIIIRRPQEVQTYLADHADLAKHVPAICSEARDEFGEKSELVLEVYHDPEIDDHYLHLLVRPVPYDRKVMERIDVIRDKFDDELSETSGWFLVTSDFASPQYGNGV